MATFMHVLFFSLIGGLLSLIGGVLLFANKSHLQTIVRYATPFAAGALLAAAFFDLLPEAIHQGEVESSLLGALTGIILFFLLEGALHWFHHHRQSDNHTDPNAWLIIIGDTLHNFIDGIAIGAAFLVSVPVGIVATIAVAAHEIPQEVGDFGLLLSKGLKKKKVIFINVMSSLATALAALLFFWAGSSMTLPLDLILGLVAGFFIYIAASDIIPDIHNSANQKILRLQSAALIFGLLTVGLATQTLHSYIDVSHQSAETSTPTEDTHNEEYHHENEGTSFSE